MYSFPLVGSPPKLRFHVISSACIPSYVGDRGVFQYFKLSLLGIGRVSRDVTYETQSRSW